MRSLKIVAEIATPLAVEDDWSPAIDAILQYLILDAEGRLNPNPTTEQLLQENTDLPLGKVEAGNDWYWKVSSPYYQVLAEEITHYRKRWEPDNGMVNWGKKKAKVVTSEGPTKAYNLPLYLRVCSTVTWFVVGDKERIETLLSRCPGIGKKHAHGYGQVIRWSVTPIVEKWDLLSAEGRVVRPVPIPLVITDSRLRKESFMGMLWGIRPPYWHQVSQRLCAMPTGNVVKVGA